MAQVKERAGVGEETRKETSLPFPLRSLSFFGSSFVSSAAKTKNPIPRSFFAPKPNGNAVSRVINKPNTQLTSDANDFVNAESWPCLQERNLSSKASAKIATVEEDQGT